MTASLDSVISPEGDPQNQIGLPYFKQRDKAQLELKIQEAAVKFSISVAVMGGPDAGKKTLLSTECQQMNTYMNKSSIKGVGIQIFTVGDNKVRINYYVAPGNEMYLKLSAKLLTGLPATIFVFDVNDDRGLDYLDDWLDYSFPKRMGSITPKKFMIANKIDTPGTRVVLSEMAKEFADINNLIHYETCANDGVKVHGVFQQIVNSLVEMAIASGTLLPQIDLRTTAKRERKPSFLDKIRKKSADEDVLSQSQGHKSNAFLDVGGSHDLTRLNSSTITAKRPSLLDLSMIFTEKEDEPEIFYSYQCQMGVSVPRRVRVFHRQQQLKESPCVNEGTLMMDWM